MTEHRMPRSFADRCAAIGQRLRNIDTRVLELALLALFLGHRLMNLFSYMDNFLAYIRVHKPDGLSWMNLTAEALRDHFWLSMLYLQQKPPLPNIYHGVMLKLFDAPFPIVWALFIGRFLISCGLYVLFFRLLLSAGLRRITAFVAVALFILSVDQFLYDMCFNGFHDPLSGLLLLVIIALCLRYALRRQGRTALLLGLASATLALTREAYMPIALVPLAWVLVAGRGRQLRHALLLLVPVLLLQGGWAVKNYAVYGYFTLQTTSWGGVNAMVGLDKTGNEEPFIATILEDAEDYPEWFVRMITTEGLVHWHPPYYFYRFMPYDIILRDRMLQTRLHGTNRSENTMGQKILSDLYWRAYLRFLRRHPELILRKFLISYGKYWQPTRYMTHLYSPVIFAVEPLFENGLDLPMHLELLRQGRIPEQHLVTLDGKDYARANYRTLDLIAYLAYLFSLVSMHTVAPLATVLALWRIRRRRREDSWPATEQVLLLSMAFWLYSALIFNLMEDGENVRFRLIVEPVIWLATVSGWLVAWRALPRFRTRPAGSEGRRPDERAVPRKD